MRCDACSPWWCADAAGVGPHPGLHGATRHALPTVEEVAALRADNERLAAEREHAQCRKLELGLLGQKAERLSPNDAQLTMQVLATLLRPRGDDTTTEPSVDEQRIGEHTRTKPSGRKPLPDRLPRVDVEIVPDEVERQGRDAFERIGEDISETVERRPASLVVVRVHRPEFVRKDRLRAAETDIVVAAPPSLPIDRGLAGPGLLADTIVRRWQDHLPLYRLEQIYAREGLDLARSTICGWHAELAEMVRPLVAAMWQDAMASPYLCTDATGVLVQAKERCRVGHFWVLIAPGRYVLYRYSARHDANAVDAMLAGYKGYLVADAHAVYDHLYGRGDVIEVGCWAHARRYFFKALESEPERAREALALIGELFRIERRLAEAPLDEREQVRRREAKPLVERFFAWCEATVVQALDETPLAKGLRYALNQRTALMSFLEDRRLPIHNNHSELALRREAVGRKNWIFVGNDDAGEVNAAFASLLASCQLHGIEPWAYLRDLFCLLPSWPARRVLELAPAAWQRTAEQPDVQRRLDRDIFRRATLSPTSVVA
jgi:transposase